MSNWQPNYKIYLNRRILYLDPSGDVFYDGRTWSATYSGIHWTEANSDINGNGISGRDSLYSGGYFPPIPSGSTAYGDIYSCPTTTTTTTTTSTTTTTTTQIPFNLFSTSATSHSFRLGSTAGGTYSVHWGDGDVATYSTGTKQVISHTYSTSYTGNISIYGSLSLIDYLDDYALSSTNLGLTFSDLAKLSNFKTLGSIDSIKLYGDVNDIPDTVDYIYKRGGGGNVYGDINNLPSSITYILGQSANNISGDISNLSSSLPNLTLMQFIDSSIYGSISGLSPSVTSFSVIGGSGTFSGSIIDLSANILNFTSDKNTIIGDISNFSSVIQSVNIKGSNTITGDISNLPLSLTSIEIVGNNTISGDISDLKSPTRFVIGGSNTITGDIANLPSTIQHINISGGNTIYGDVSTFPSSLKSIDISGTNSISGDLAQIPANVTYISLSGDNTVNSYTSGRNWANGMNHLNLYPLSPFSTASTDDILIDLSSATWSGTSKLISIRGYTSSSSDSAVTTLLSKGVSVSIIT